MQELLDSVKSLSGKERKALAALLKKQEVNLYGITPIFKREPDELPLLSYAQQRQWFLWQLEPESAAYNIATALSCKGALNLEALQKSFRALMARHETLRTTFALNGEQPVQVIHPDMAFEPNFERLEAADEAAVRSCVEEEMGRPFDLLRGPLLRVKLLQLAKDEYVLVLTLHHIVADGWSMPIMVDELVRLYAGYCQGGSLSLPELPIQYADYAIWQRNWMEAGEREQQLAYWQAQLGGEQPVLELPVDRSRPPRRTYAGDKLSIELERDLVRSLKALAQSQGVTLFMLLLASFQTLLHRYSGQNDIRVGVPIANRTQVETEPLIGFFVNTQVLKAKFDLQMSFNDLLQQVRQTVLDAQGHQDLPFQQLVEALHPERSLSHNPLFQVMYNHQTHGQGGGLALPGLEIQVLEYEQHTAQFDLTLNTFESEAGLWASLSFATELFDRASIERIARHWINLLQAVVRQPQQRIAELSLLDALEQRQIVQGWNRTEVDYPVEHCIHELIELQVTKTPQATALVFGERSLSYDELNRQANRLAHKLREMGVGPDGLVGLAVERSLEMVVGLLGILKAGGAYVPLDPEYPQERLTYMLHDSGVRLLLSQAHLQGRVPVSPGVEVLNLDQVDDELAAYSDANPVNWTELENLAYVIYTSGSTGRPKGAGNSHKALFNRLAWMQKAYGLGQADTVLQKTPFSFDVSVWEFFWPLQNGARLVLAQPGEHREPDRLIETIKRHEVTTLHFVPSMLQVFMVSEGVEGCHSIRRTLCSGEALPGELARKALQRLPRSGLFNLYGPTEAAIDVTHWRCGPGEGAAVPIGRPIDNLKTHVLTPSLLPAAQGCLGELYLGGVGLARGYHQRPSLTAERFVPDPFDSSGQGGGRLYRSGDLACYRNDGVIDYLGRSDHQVKIRGLRIELGEIEARLQEHPAIREAVVIDSEGPGGKQLVAYLVAVEPITQAEWQSQLQADLRGHLQATLPDYMVPSHLLLLDGLPLSPNGKLERKALPRPDMSLQRHDHVPPQSDLERQVAAIWGEVLKVERVGLNDDFFALGGHSLLATQVISRVRQLMGVELSLRVLFEAPVLATFVARFAGAQGNRASRIEPVDRQAPLELSYAQQRQWFLWQLEPDGAAYNIPLALRLNGALDIEALQRSFAALTARHETLRTTFRQEGELIAQVVHPRQRLDIPCVALDHESEIAAQVEAEIQRPFDLVDGPLLRARLLRLAGDEHVLVLTLHHIVADGWSMSMMARELVTFYESYRQGREPSLPALPIQYADYAHWQRRWMEAGEQARQLEYWTQQLGGEQPVLELPTDRPRPLLRSHAGASLAIQLDSALSGAIRALAQEQGVTLFMLLLASFQALLHRYSGQREIRVGVPVANRNRVETEPLIGFFVNTQVLRAEFDLQLTFTELLAQVGSAALAAQMHQDLPFEQLVEALQPERSLSHSPLFQVMYNHQTQVKDAGLVLSALDIEVLELANRSARFDLTLDTFESETGLWASLTFATDLFDEATIERMGRHWVALLQGAVRQPQRRIADLPLLSADEYRRIVQEWGRPQSTCLDELCVHHLIERQVAKTPQATALVFGEQSLSYAELNQRANRLAGRLRELGVGAEVLVGIAMERSLDMVVGLLAILKAGGAYVPLDPDYPQERLAYMLEHSGARLLLTQERLLEHLPIVGIATWCMDRDWPELQGYACDDLELTVHPEHPAYCIYTSGSTGKPKGVTVRHLALVNFLASMARQPGLSAADRVLALTSLSFDIAGLELYLPLLVGASVVLLADRENQDPRALLELIERQAVTTVQATPSTWRMLLDAASPEALRHCRLLSGGEALAPDLAKRLLERSAQVWNLYGPTETTIWSGLHCLTPRAPTPLLGKPIANTYLHIVEQELSAAPVGVAGELLIGGDGLARGYLHRPDLTAERFVPDPFDTSEQGGGRLYRTGDLARYHADGTIEYLSRIDHQVKIRGFRIELGEIEARLLEHEAVREAVVVDVDGPGGKQLAAYLVAVVSDLDAQRQSLLRTSLRDHLRVRLPEYMVPVYLLLLDSLPLTPNGKLNRKALPLPDASQQQRHHVAPQSELERQLAAIWGEVLKVDRVGLTDNFFELGGHSLLAAQTVSRINGQLGIDIPLRLIFENPALGEFSSALERQGLSLRASDLTDIENMMNELAGV